MIQQITVLDNQDGTFTLSCPYNESIYTAAHDELRNFIHTMAEPTQETVFRAIKIRCEAEQVNEKTMPWNDLVALIEGQTFDI